MTPNDGTQNASGQRTADASTARESAVAAILEQQYAYFIYRSLECVSHLVTGTSRVPSEFDRTSRLYVRVINLLSRHGAALPGFDEVLPASEGLASLLFHTSVCHREAYWPALNTAHERCFGDTRDRLLSKEKDAINASDELVSLVALFDRALREYATTLDGETPGHGYHHSAAVLQAGEWADTLLQEARRAAAAVPASTH